MDEIELISLIVGSGIKDLGFREISEKVYSVMKKKLSNGGVKYSDLLGVKGVGEITAIKLFAGIELGRRLYVSSENNVKIKNSRSAVPHLFEIMDKKKEYVKAIYLNARYELLKSELLSIGTLARVSVTPRDILVPALESNAAYIIIGHNHPSGNPSPSRSDILLTKRIQDACEILGVKLLDHIIVSSNGRWCNLITADGSTQLKT